ncbi:hypothetical protein [Ruegeria meonggei]|uniref:Uncharacterized protein n=1 Tax=Ruegeria meonggei TaxID=1446476 RepID=A0A1X6Z1I6_9RHOB|nr:hypothetical protein [Ruegeria meonggei]SLN37674.1 hypothetical protein RUM8411_01639 [Ruegeria meonggei]
MHETVKKMLQLVAGGFPLDKPIIIDDGSGCPSVVAFFSDLELDVFMLRFVDDGAVELVTDDYEHVAFTADILTSIEFMIEDADELWRTLDPFWSDKKQHWVGWEHLATAPENIE